MLSFAQVGGATSAAHGLHTLSFHVETAAVLSAIAVPVAIYTACEVIGEVVAIVGSLVRRALGLPVDGEE